MPSLNLDIGLDTDVIPLGPTAYQSGWANSRRNGARLRPELDNSGEEMNTSFRDMDAVQAESSSTVGMIHSTRGQTGNRYTYGQAGSSRFQSHPIPPVSPTVNRSPSSSSLAPSLNGSRSNKREGLSRRLSSPTMGPIKASSSPTSRSQNVKFGATPTKSPRDSGLGLTVDEASEMVFPSLAPSLSVITTADAVTSAVSSAGKTRYRSGSVGSRVAETKTAHTHITAPLFSGQPSRSRYNRSFTTSRVDLPSETFAKGERGLLSSLAETIEITSNPPSPGDVKGKGRAYDRNVGIDDLDDLRVDQGYISGRTSRSFESTDGQSLQTGYSSVPSATDDSSHLVELATPTVTSAAGGILTGLWFAGKQVGQAIGLLPQDLSAGRDGYQNDAVYNRGKRRSSAWMSYPIIRRTSASDGEESEKGLLSHEESGGEDDMGGLAQRGPSLSYFDLPKSTYATTSHTLPTPALSSKSLSNPDARNTYVGGEKSGLSKESTLGLSSFRRMKERILRGEEYNPAQAAMPSPEAKAHREGRGRSGTLSSTSGPFDMPHETVKMNVALKQVVGELGWTLGMLGVVFVVSLGIVAASLVSLPMYVFSPVHHKGMFLLLTLLCTDHRSRIFPKRSLTCRCYPRK